MKHENILIHNSLKKQKVNFKKKNQFMNILKQIDLKLFYHQLDYT